MAKRLTDTEKWNDDWYISLCNDYRIVWQWLLDNCNHAGICKRSMKLVNMMCETELTEDEMLKIMVDRVVIVGGNWFIPKFVRFQYATLGSNKPVIVSVMKELERHNLIPMIIELFGNDYLIIKDKDKDKDKGIKKGSMRENIVGETFDEEKENVIFSDGTKQKLGQSQRFEAEQGTLSARAMKKGMKAY